MEKRSYEEKIILFGCLLGVIGFLPFTIFRYIDEDYLLAFIESCLAIFVLGLFVYVWRTRRFAGPGILLCSLYLFSAVTVIHIKGPILIYWFYPPALATFCVLNHRTAAVLNLLAALLILPAIYTKLDTQEVITIYVTIALLSVFSYTFTIITQKQRVQLSQLAERDALTGTLNRRALDENMLMSINRLGRNSSKKTSLIILDLDHFKAINDTYGHSTGDQILIRIAELIRSSIRMSDRLFRYGGEEFVIIAENSSSENARKLAENIREKVEQSNLFSKRSITISLGVSQLNKDLSADQWLSNADEALYEAKRSGRNKVCVAGRVSDKTEKIAAAACITNKQSIEYLA